MSLTPGFPRVVHVNCEPLDDERTDSHIVNDVHIVHHHNCLPIYSEANFVIFKSVLLRELVVKIETSGSKVEIVYQLNGDCCSD